MHYPWDDSASLCDLLLYANECFSSGTDILFENLKMIIKEDWL